MLRSIISQQAHLHAAGERFTTCAGRSRRWIAGSLNEVSE